MMTRRSLIVLLSAILLLAGIVALGTALRAIRKGRVAMGKGGGRRMVRRDAEPVWFWTSISLHILVSAFLFAFGLTAIGVIPGGWLQGFRR